jgi:hypothetical protein
MGRLDDHQQAAGGQPERVGHALLEGGELDQVGVTLGAEVDAVGVGDEFDRAAGQPEVEQADAGNVGGVGRRRRGARRLRAAEVTAEALVETGAIKPSGSVDWTALRWHLELWDPWFLVWGLLLAVATRGYAITRSRADPAS